MEDVKEIIAIINTEKEKKSYGLIKVDREYESDIKVVWKGNRMAYWQEKSIKKNRGDFRKHILFCMEYGWLKEIRNTYR